MSRGRGKLVFVLPLVVACGTAPDDAPAPPGELVATTVAALTSYPNGVTVDDEGPALLIKNGTVWARLTWNGAFHVGRNGRTGFTMAPTGDDIHEVCILPGDPKSEARICGTVDRNQAVKGHYGTAGGGCAYYQYNSMKVGGVATPTSMIWTVCLNASEEVDVYVGVGGEAPGQASGFIIESLAFPHPAALSSTGKGYAVVPNMEGFILPVGWVSSNTEQAWFHYDHMEFAAQSRDWSMPFYGIVEEDGRALYVEARTSNDSLLRMRNPQGGTPRLNVQHNASLGGFQQGGTRNIVYVPLDNANYVTLAKRYRSRVQATGRFRSLTNKISSRPDVGRLIGGAMLRQFALTYQQPSNDMKVEMSFADIRTRLDALSREASFPIAKGVLHLNGAGQRGFDNLHPDFVLPSSECTGTLPADVSAGCGPHDRVGGYPGLRTLVDYSRTPGTILVEIHDNYRDFYEDSLTFQRHPEYALRMRNDEMLRGHPWAGGPNVALCPSRALPLLDRTYDQLLAAGVRPTAYYLDVLSALPPDECYNQGARVSRTQTLGFWTQLLEYLSNTQRVVTSSEEPVDWSSRYIDHAHWTSHRRGERRSDPREAKLLGEWGYNTPVGIPVPLWSLVYHDSVVAPFALTTGERFEGTFDAWEAGGPPMAELADTASIGVRRAMTHQMALHGLVGTQPLENHRFLDTDGRFMVAESRFGSNRYTIVDRKAGTVRGTGLTTALNETRAHSGTYAVKVEATTNSVTTGRSTTADTCIDVPVRWQADDDYLSREPSPMVRLAHVERFWNDQRGSASNPRREVIVNGDANVATSTWTRGRIVTDTLSLCVQLDDPVGEYPVLVGLYGAQPPYARLPLASTRGDDRIPVGMLRIGEGTIGFRKQITGSARLVLARQSGSRTVEVMTEWMLGPWVPNGQTVFLHAMADGQIVANADYVPTSGTATWPYFSRRREHRRTFTLPATNGIRRYTIVTGLYDPTKTGIEARVPLSGANPETRVISLGTLIVQGDGTNINSVRFWPTGTCSRFPVEDHWRADGLPSPSESSAFPWRLLFGDAGLDRENNLLVLTPDDIVRRDPLATWPTPAGTDKGYVLSFEATFAGTIAFHPDLAVQNSTQKFPAIRRVGSQLELGGLRYGNTEPWGTFGNFTGQRIDADSVRVTLFVRGDNQLAMRVEDGVRVHSSGFVAFPSAFGQLHLVGANSNNGPNGSVRISEVNGCTAFPDADVLAAYER